MATATPPVMDLAAPGTAPRVLFACSPDGNRSLLAAALLTHLAGPGLDVAWARSQTPCIHPFTLAVLNERGVSAEAPRACLSDTPPDTFDVLVHIGHQHDSPLAGAWPAHQTLRWTLINPVQAGKEGPSLHAFRYARDDLERRAWRLLERVEQVQAG